MTLLPRQPRGRSALARSAFAALVCSAMLMGLSGCSVHTGGDTIAFIRKGVLWTIHPDGTNSVYVAAGTVVSFAWSPNHHELVYRSGSSALLAAQSLSATTTLGPPDAPSLISVASINGGTALQISPDQDTSLRSDAWWDPSGHRLLYAEYFASPSPVLAYIQSQADQPAGIARKRIEDAATLPVLSPDGKQVAVVDAQGDVLLGSAERPDRAIATGALVALPQVGRPARILWQPRHNGLLYATASPGGVSLVLHGLASSQATVIGTTSIVLDYAFSPDGTRLLVQTPAGLELWSVTQPGPPLYTWIGRDPYALAWWSHDSATILMQDRDGWRLLDARTGASTVLLMYSTPADNTPITQIASWRPAAGSPWSADDSHIVFVSGPGIWRDAPLALSHTSSAGLYVADPRSVTAKPRIIDGGPDIEPSWSYADPSTTFLVAG